MLFFITKEIRLKNFCFIAIARVFSKWRKTSKPLVIENKRNPIVLIPASSQKSFDKVMEKTILNKKKWQRRTVLKPHDGYFFSVATLEFFKHGSRSLWEFLRVCLRNMGKKECHSRGRLQLYNVQCRSGGRGSYHEK